VTSINRSHAPFEADTVEYHNWQGGGGYGDPLDRTPDRVADDVRAGAVSVDVAEHIYGVVLRDGKAEPEATTQRRAVIRASRLGAGRPASQVLGVPGANDLGASWIDETRAAGRTSYGDVVDFDFDRGVASCMACQHELGPANGDFRLGCLVEVTTTSAAGPVRGQDYADDTVHIRHYYCPGCARRLEAEVAAASGPYAGFRIAAPPIASR